MSVLSTHVQHTLQLEQESAALLRCVHAGLAEPQQQDRPVLLRATPGLGKTHAFVAHATQLLIDYHTQCILPQAGDDACRQFWSTHPPLWYLARTIGEIAVVKEQILRSVTQQGTPEFQRWMSTHRHELLVIAPTHLSAAEAAKRQAQTREPILFHPQRPESPLYPDFCHRAQQANTLLDHQHHRISQTICHQCPSQQDRPPCGTLRQLRKAFFAPIVFSTTNRLSAPDDRLSAMQFASGDPIPRNGFVDDYSDSLFSDVVLQPAQLDTWDWVLKSRRDIWQERYRKAAEKIEQLRIGPRDTGRAPRRAEASEPLSYTPDSHALHKARRQCRDAHAMVQALEILSSLVLPGLRDLYAQGAKVLSRWHHHPQKGEERFLRLAQQVPLQQSLQRLWRRAESVWEGQLTPIAGLRRLPSLQKFLTTQESDWESIEVTEGQLGLLPGDLLPVLLEVVASGALVASWDVAGKHQHVVQLHLQRLRPIWKTIHQRGFWVADATPDPLVQGFLSDQHIFQSPWHPDASLQWRHSSVAYKSSLQRSAATRKSLLQSVVPMIQQEIATRSNRQSVVAHRELYSDLRQAFPQESVGKSYFGGGGGQGHRAHNQFAGHDLHLLGIPRLSPQDVARAYLQWRLLASFYPGLPIPKAAVHGVYRPDIALMDAWGNKTPQSGLAQFRDPMARLLADSFTERELVQAIHRSRPIHHPVHIRIIAPVADLNWSSYGVPTPTLFQDLPRRACTIPAVVLPQAPGDVSAPSAIDPRVLAGLASDSPWQERDTRGRKRPPEILSFLPSVAEILRQIQEKTGVVLHSRALREALTTLSRFAEQQKMQKRQFWRWCHRTLRTLQRRVEANPNALRDVFAAAIRYWKNRTGARAHCQQQQWTLLFSVFFPTGDSPPG